MDMLIRVFILCDLNVFFIGNISRKRNIGKIKREISRDYKYNSPENTSTAGPVMTT